jgi:hypothetical protein
MRPDWAPILGNPDYIADSAIKPVLQVAQINSGSRIGDVSNEHTTGEKHDGGRVHNEENPSGLHTIGSVPNPI